MENKLLHRGYRLTQIRMDKAGENTTNELLQFCTENGIALELSPAYASQRNGAAERLVQEHWARTRVLMFDADLPKDFGA